MAGERVNLIHVVFYRFLYVVRNIDKYMFCVHSKNAFLSKMKLSSDYEYTTNIYAWKKITRGIYASSMYAKLFGPHC